MKVWNVTFTVLPLLILYLKFEACHFYSLLISTDLATYTDTCSEENPFQQFLVTIIIIVTKNCWNGFSSEHVCCWPTIIVGQQQIPKIFGK